MILYGAYGSNLNDVQMRKRCPNAQFLQKINIRGWKLVFKGVADIIRFQKAITFFGVYSLTKNCELSLDKYEDYPYLYIKKKIFSEQLGREILVYVMNKRYKFGTPTLNYYKIIEQGYSDRGLNYKSLTGALKYSILRASKNHYILKDKSPKINMMRSFNVNYNVYY